MRGVRSALVAPARQHRPRRPLLPRDVQWLVELRLSWGTTETMVASTATPPAPATRASLPPEPPRATDVLAYRRRHVQEQSSRGEQRVPLHLRRIGSLHSLTAARNRGGRMTSVVPRLLSRRSSLRLVVV